VSLEYGKVNAGRLRHRVTLQQLPANRTPSPRGQLPSNWATVATFWADVAPLQGRELSNAQQIKATVTHRLTMRWPGSSLTITPSMRFTWGSRIFNIVAVLNADERNRRLDIIAEEQKVPPGT
jgi:SPP1 family predicted phage head-tail adaptor